MSILCVKVFAEELVEYVKLRVVAEKKSVDKLLNYHMCLLQSSDLFQCLNDCKNCSRRAKIIFYMHNKVILLNIVDCSIPKIPNKSIPKSNATSPQTASAVPKRLT